MAFGVSTNRLSSFQPFTSQKWKITSQRLLDQSQAGVYMGKTPHTPILGYSRTLPQGLNC